MTADEPKLASPPAAAEVASAPPTPTPTPAPAPTPTPTVIAPTTLVSTTAPMRQMNERAEEELEILAEDLGLKPRQYKTRQQLVVAIHDRRQLIAEMNRDAMVDVLRWANRPPPPGASKEALAQQIVALRTMRFDGLTQRGLAVLAALRGAALRGDEDVPTLVRRLKGQEGLLAKLDRKRRALLGSMISNLVDQPEEPTPEKSAGSDETVKPRATSIKHEIEEAGLLGGLAGRIKRSADGYVNQKLDEIEARIDRKLDEIDRRLAEWRDKEIANRILILKITLWASVIVGLFSLIYSYIRIHFVH